MHITCVGISNGRLHPPQMMALRDKPTRSTSAYISASHTRPCWTLKGWVHLCKHSDNTNQVLLKWPLECLLREAHVAQELRHSKTSGSQCVPDPTRPSPGPEPFKEVISYAWKTLRTRATRQQRFTHAAGTGMFTKERA